MADACPCVLTGACLQRGNGGHELAVMNWRPCPTAWPVSLFWDKELVPGHRKGRVNGHLQGPEHGLS